MDAVLLPWMENRIKFIRNITVIRDQEDSGLLLIKARGVADLRMLLNPVLVPRKYDLTPEDGIFELDFELDETLQDHTDVELDMEVVIKLRDIPKWVRGIKVNAEENSDIELV